MRRLFCQSDTIAVCFRFSVSVLALSGASRQLPQRGSLWRVGQLSSGRAKHNISETVVLRCLGQQQLDKERCPEAAALCSKARPFAPYRAFSVQRRAARPAKASPFGSNGDDRRQWRKQGEAVGAAASRMRAVAKQTLGAATRAVARRRRDGEGKPVTAKPPHSDEQTLLSERYYRCAFASRQRPCPLRRFAPALPKGEPFRTPHRTARSR